MTSMRCSGNKPGKRGQMEGGGGFENHCGRAAGLQRSDNSSCYPWMIRKIPSGSALLNLRAVMILFTSLSILFAIPGYWRERFDWVILFYLLTYDPLNICIYLSTNTYLTWIFMATSRPSFIFAKWTWPMDAAANGLSSKYSSLSLQFGPRSL